MQPGKLKPAAIEAFDHHLPSILALEPAPLGRSWHPAPFLIWSAYTRFNPGERFTELQCAGGILGRIRATDALPLMLANAGKLKPYGA